MSRTATPSQNGHWSIGSPSAATGSHASSSSAPDCIGVTRSRTLLFLSFRDSVPRGYSSRPRQRKRDAFADSEEPQGTAGSRSSSRKGKARKNDAVYFDFDDDDEDEVGAQHTDGRTSSDCHPLDEDSPSSPLLQSRPSIDYPPEPRRRLDHTSVDMSSLPPRWVDASEQIDSILSSLNPQIATLDRLQAKHLLPGFVDRTQEEREIAKLQGEITREFRKCSKLIAGLAQFLQREVKSPRGAAGMSKEEAILARNVQTALAQRVQDASGQFRKKQSNYMQRLKGQDVRHREVLGELGLAPKPSRPNGDSAGLGEAQGEELAAREDMEMSRAHLAEQQQQQQQQGRGQQQKQMLLIDSESQRDDVDHDVARRQSEITRIASSIVELSQLFQDLQSLVIDQGSLVDRIDYNIETMGKDMAKANEELQVATKTQRRTGRGQCILFLVLLCALLIAIIIVKPFWRFLVTDSPR